MDNITEQLEELEKKKQELLRLEREKEQSKSVVVAVQDFYEGFYKVKPNQERSNISHSNYGRYDPRNKTYEIAQENWAGYESMLSKQVNVIVFYVPAVRKKVEEYLNRSDVLISREGPHFHIQLTKKGGEYNARITSEIASKLRYMNKAGHYTLSVLEVEELVKWVDWLKTCAIHSKVEIDKDALEFMNKEVDRIKLLDDLASAEDVQLDVSLNNATPMPFQKVGVKFVEASGGKCLIGDEMGLGKTIQALMYAKWKDLRTLAIVPPNLIDNWSREIESKLGIVPRVYKGLIPSNFDIEDMILNKDKYKISLIGYPSIGHHDREEVRDRGMLLSVKKKYVWANLINLAGYELIICDEVHRIKNINSARSQGVRTIKTDDKNVIGLSGTPVLNRPAELQPFFNWIAPDKVPNYYDFIYRFTDGKNGVKQGSLGELRNLLRPLMIRRKKSDVIKELPALIHERIFYEMSDEERSRYSRIVDGIFDIIGDRGDIVDSLDITSVLAQLTRLKQYCSALVVNTIADYAVEVLDENSDSEYKKIIIFSQFRDTAEAIAKRLGHECVNFDGTMEPSKRMALVDRFQQDDSINFLVATTKSASEGLNITKAGHVMFADLMWTPADHSQAIARAYGRLSDCHGVVVHWHIVKDTIMQWIEELLNQKEAMAGEVVDGVKEERNRSSIVGEIMKRLRGKR